MSRGRIAYAAGRTSLGRVRNRIGARDDGGHAQLGAKLRAAENGLEQGCVAAR